jgi:hypothetical protein
MYLKPPKASTDPRLRSLLQKAVRRGAERVVNATVRAILALGDRAWLRSRSIVITFEESWPLAESLVLTRDPQSRAAALLHVCRSAKQKDAAGLGALAFAFHEGDQSMLDLVPSERDLRIVSEGLDRPGAYFDWVLSQCTSAKSWHVAVKAREYLPAASWGWDKATILAAALLAASGGVPALPPVEPADSNFPYWVALDKHTPEGKAALRGIGIKYGIGYRQLIWAGFYCESAVVNMLEPSVWFEGERAWRLRKTGLTTESAMGLWIRVRPTLVAELSAAAESLRAQVEDPAVGQSDLFT